jgi:hypothetical protein
MLSSISSFLLNFQRIHWSWFWLVRSPILNPHSRTSILFSHVRELRLPANPNTRRLARPACHSSINLTKSASTHFFDG